jgi:hypothetical protein
MSGSFETKDGESMEDGAAGHEDEEFEELDE